MKVHGINSFGQMAERNEPTPVTVSIERDELDRLQRGFNALEAVKQIAQRAYNQGNVFVAEDRGVISVCANYDWSDRVVNALVRRHFIQGKAGRPGRFVHTRLGLEEWRRLEAETPIHD